MSSSPDRPTTPGAVPPSTSSALSAQGRQGQPPAPHRRSTAVWTLLVPAALTVGAVGIVLGWRDELPDPVASHWGAAGVDGYSSLNGLILPLVAILLAFCLTLWAVGHWRGQQAMTRRFTNGMAVWLTVFLNGILLGTLWVQRGLTDASEAGGVGGVLGVALLAATVLAGLVAWAGPGDAPAPTSSPVPADAPRLALSDAEQVVWVREIGRRATWLLLVATLGPLVLIGALTREWFVPAVMAPVLALLLVAFLRWTVVVDRNGLTARSVLRLPRLHVPLDEVERAEVVDVSPLGEFGGWGLRTALDGRTGVVLRAGPAIQVHRTGGRITVVTVDDAETAAALLNTLASRARLVREAGQEHDVDESREPAD